LDQKKGVDRWGVAVLQQCEKYNNFASPLPVSEVRSIAKSVAKWTWQKYTGRMDDKDFSKIQAMRAIKRNKKSPQKKLTEKIEGVNDERT
jgi:hypothetical protein